MNSDFIANAGLCRFKLTCKMSDITLFVLLKADAPTLDRSSCWREIAGSMQVFDPAMNQLLS